MTAPLTPRQTAVIGAALVAVGPISMALYTPAMPALVEAFQSTPAIIKLTLTAYFAGFSLAQLVCGPLSDAFGRRPIALVFLVLYLGGSLVAAFAPGIEWLLMGRLVQGIGAAAGVALSRAIVRDLFTGQASARIMNTIGLMLAVGPAMSPALGGIMLSSLGWQSIFGLMVVYGIALILVVQFVLPETLAERNPSHMRPRRLLANYATLLTDRRFMAPGLVVGLTLGGLYTMAAVLPFVMIEYVGLTPTEFGFAMIAQSGSYVLGALITGQILKHVEAHRMVPLGIAIVAAAGALMALALRLVEPSFLVVMVPVGLWAFGIAFLLPSTTTDALGPFPAIAGSAAALMGFLQIGGGFAGSAVAALFGDPLTALATVLPAMAAATVAIHVLFGRRDPAAFPPAGDPSLLPAEPAE